MTKKHYKMFAELMRKHNINMETQHDFVVELCRVFLADNPNFQTQTFIEALVGGDM